MCDRLDTKNRELYRYSTQYKTASRLSDRLIEKVVDLSSREGNFDEHSLQSKINAARMTGYGIAAVTADSAEVRKKRKELLQILGCAESKFAIDVNELTDRRDSTRYYGGDFTYSAAIKKEWLKNLTLIFGNAHLEALDEMSCLTSLESVWGDIYFSRCTDLSGLVLRHIGGDLHGERLASVNGLEQLDFVGGTIYFQDHQFGTLEMFRSLVTI